MLITGNENSTVIEINCTRYCRYNEIIQITGGQPLRLQWRAAITATMEARFEVGKEKGQMV